METAPTQPPRKRPRRELAARLAVLLACLAAAFLAAFYFRETPAPPPAAAPVAPAPPAPPAGILAAIPIPASQSAADQELLAARQRVQKKPEDAVAWIRLGDALAQELRDTADQKYYDFAEMAYRRALALNARSADAMTGLAWVEGGRHLFEKSAAWATQALAIEPTNPEAFGILGDAALELGQYDDAFEHYQRMMDARPDLASWSRGAHLLWLTGEKDKAMWLMDKAIKAGAPFAENTAWCRAKLATMLLHDGALEAAEEVLAPALRAPLQNTHALLAAARVAVARQDFTTARQHCEAVLTKGPNHEALASLGDLHAVKGEAALAEKFYAEVEALHAAHVAGAVHDHMQMARFYADHDRQPLAALRLAEQHKLTQNVLEADTLAWVYFKNGDLPRAGEAIQRALSRNTPEPAIHYHAGMIALAAGDHAIAQKHLQRALGANPHFDLLHAPLAAAALEKLGLATVASP